LNRWLDVFFTDEDRLTSLDHIGTEVQLMEQLENYESAALYYSQALSVETKDKTI
jgi:hypothetical protein